MSLIPQVGRKSTGSRLFLGLCYVLLTFGAVTMIYPFLLMAGNSVTTEYDWRHFRIVPKYMVNDFELFAKYITDKDGLLLFGERYGKSGLNPTNIRVGD